MSERRWPRGWLVNGAFVLYGAALLWLAIQVQCATASRDALRARRAVFCTGAASELEALSLLLAEPAQQEGASVTILDPHFDDAARLCVGRPIVDAFVVRREACFNLPGSRLEPDFDCARLWAAQLAALIGRASPP